MHRLDILPLLWSYLSAPIVKLPARGLRSCKPEGSAPPSSNQREVDRSAVSKATTCSSCDAGTYSEGLAAVNCSSCEAGKASSTRASECYDCESGESWVVTISSLRTGPRV